MVSLRKFLENCSLQSQLQERLNEYLIDNKGDVSVIKSPEVNETITGFIQAALENYIAQVYISQTSFESPEELEEAILNITYYLSPEIKAKIVENCSDEDAYKLGRTFYNCSEKKHLPC